MDRTLKSMLACSRYGQRKPNHSGAEKDTHYWVPFSPFFQAPQDRGLAVLSDPPKYGGKIKYS